MRNLLASVILVAGCATDPTAAPAEPSALALSEHTPTDLSGSFTHADLTIRFTAHEDLPQRVTQTYEIGDLVVVATSDHAEGLGRIESNGVLLSATGKEALTALNHALGQALPAGSRGLVDDVVDRTSGYLATAAANEIIPTFDFKNNHSITYIDHCWCSWQYIGCTAGAGCYWHTVGTGFGCVGELAGNGCKGRCGTGCPSDGHSGAYTWDCARHDYNLESWTAASDDFLFAWYNC